MQPSVVRPAPVRDLPPRQTAPLFRLELSTRGVLVGLLGLATLWALVRLWDVFILIVVAIMLATALLPFVEWLMGRGLSRGASVGVVALLLVAGIALLGALVVPALINEGQSFQERFPALKADVVTTLRAHQQPKLAAQVEQFQLSDVVRGDQVVSTSRQVLGIVIAALTVLVLTIYILIDARRIERFFYFAVPDRWHEHIQNLLPALRTTVGGYIRGQLITSGVIAVFTFTVLFALGVPDALGLGVLAGIADAIPLIGAFIAIIPGTIAALAVSPTAAIITVVALVLYQQFEDRMLVPRVYGRTLRLPTVVVFLAIIIGVSLMGIMGAVLALPAAAAVRVCILYGHSVRQGRVEPVAPEDELFAPDEAEASPATVPELTTHT